MKSPPPAFILAALFFVAAHARAQERLLTKAIEVRSLTVAEAESGIPARLRGSVIFFESSAVFVQDETSTTFFRPQDLAGIRLGDVIEVRGRTQPGLFLPGIGPADFRLLGHAPLPAAIRADFDDLVSARYHYQRVVVEGIVRSLSPIPGGRFLMRLALGSRLLEVRIETPPDREHALVDSRVRVHGLAAGFINDRRQLVKPYVRVQNWTEVTVLDRATPDAEVPSISAPELLAFRVTGFGERRVRIAGTVIAVFPKGQIYIRQEKTALAVRIDAPTPLTAGDRIEVLGFPEMGLFSASVTDAKLARREPGAAPAPVELASPNQLTGAYDGDLVALTALLTNVFSSDRGTELVLQHGSRTIQARAADTAVAAKPGSRVRVTGICLVEAGEPSQFSARAGVVSLHLRSPNDLQVLQPPPWWTAQRLGMLLAGLAGLTLLAAVWIAVLRRQVARQTTLLRHRIESEAALEERQRIAREFHDTLEQELAGVSLRLDALATRELEEKGRDLIRATRNLVSRIQAETRDLICDLRDPVETTGDIVAALKALATRQEADNGIKVHVAAAAPLPSLSAGVVHDLRMIARESVTNARKHGAATHITIEIAATDTRLNMKIGDNGCGFDPAAPETRSGHFGCAGMRERGRKLGADVVWRAVPGTGMTVEVSLPLANHQHAPADETKVASEFPPGRIDAPAAKQLGPSAGRL